MRNNNQWFNNFGRNSIAQSVLAICLISTAAVATADEQCDAGHDYPTAVIADYVLGCMAANGNTYESLHQCSCSIDFIKTRVTFEEYEKAQTVMQVKLDRGQRGVFFRDSNWAKNTIEGLEKAQAESTLRCF